MDTNEPNNTWLRSACSASSTHKAFSYTDSKGPGPKNFADFNTHPRTRREVGSSSSTFLG